MKSSPELPSAAVDSAVLESLRDLGGDDDPTFLSQLLTSFLAHADRAVAELRDAAATGSIEKARAVAHGLKGSAGNVGAKPLAALAARIESVAKGPAGSIARADVDAIVREVARVRERLTAEMR